MTALAPGIHDDLAADAYHGDPAERPSLSSSIARILVAASPAHARAAHPRLNPTWQPDNDAKYDLGTVVHGLLLQGAADVEVLDFDSWRTNAAKDARELAYAAGRTPMLTRDWEQAEAVTRAVRSQLEWLDVDPPLLRDGKPEQTVVWEDRGVLCRARIDWLRDDLQAIDDLKTTSRTANPDGFARTLFQMGYDLQAVFYTRGIYKLTSLAPTFRFLVVETTPPYAVSVVGLAADALALANEKLDWALAKWRECLETDRWPAYPSKLVLAEAPVWAEAQWLAFEGRDEVAA